MMPRMTAAPLSPAAELVARLRTGADIAEGAKGVWVRGKKEREKRGRGKREKREKRESRRKR